RTVFACLARDRLWRCISSIYAPLVWNRQTPDAVGILASLSSASEIPNCRRLRALQTTGGALPCLLARLVCNSSSVPPPRVWHRSHSPTLPHGDLRRLNRTLGLHRFPRRDCSDFLYQPRL